MNRALKKLTLEDLERMQSEMIGLCGECGEEVDCVEGDAEGYDCPHCGAEGTVDGAHFALIERATEELVKGAADV